MALFWLMRWLMQVLVFPRATRIFGLFILIFSRSFELEIRAKVGDNPAISRDLASLDQVRAQLVPLANGTSDLPADVARVIRQLAAVHVDEVEHDAVGALKIEGPSGGAFQEVARIRLVVG